MKIKGWKKDGDELKEPLKVWLIPERNQMLCCCSEKSASDGSYLSSQTIVLLNGWQHYAWKNSKIFAVAFQTTAALSSLLTCTFSVIIQIIQKFSEWRGGEKHNSV